MHKALPINGNHWPFTAVPLTEASGKLNLSFQLLFSNIGLNQLYIFAISPGVARASHTDYDSIFHGIVRIA